MWVEVGGSSTGTKLRVQSRQEASMTEAGEFATTTTPVIATAKTMMSLKVDLSVEASRKAAPRNAAARER